MSHRRHSVNDLIGLLLNRFLNRFANRPSPCGYWAPPSERTTKSVTVRVFLDVVAGLVSGRPIDKYTRRFAITEDQWKVRLTDMTAKATEAEWDAYARELRTGGLKWVQTTWTFV